MRRRCLSRGVPLPDLSDVRGLAGRLVLPSSSGGAHGVQPFAGLLPRRVDLHLCTSGPTCLCIAPPDPIDFRRVDSPRLHCASVREKATANRGRLDVGFWASLPSAVRFAIFSPGRTRTRRYLNRDRSCLGLCLFQVCRHTRFTHPCASMRARPRVDHQPPDASRDTSHPLMRLGDPSR